MEMEMDVTPSKIHVYVNVGVTTVYMYCLE